MKATINDVAVQAGVSIKTVSRVINNEPSVRQATRDKVQTAVNALNYQPNFAARNLAAAHSFSVAYIYDNPNAYYVIDTQEGILAACKQQGFELLIHPCKASKENIFEEISLMVEQSRIAGLILTPPFSEIPDFVQSILSLNVKVVRIMSGDEAPDKLTPCVMINDRAAAQTITQHLIDQGHTKIGFLAGDSQHMSTVERYKGYKKALEINGLEFDPQRVIEGSYAFEFGVAGTKELMAHEEAPSAIFSCNDEIAAGSLYAARLMNKKIPEELAIVGFENSPFSRQTWPQMTTADQPNKEIAENAAKLLISLIRQQESNHIVCQYVPQLVIRNSTAS